MEQNIQITKELISKVNQLSNPIKVDNYLKMICEWQQILIENLYKQLQELKQVNND